MGAAAFQQEEPEKRLSGLARPWGQAPHLGSFRLQVLMTRAQRDQRPSSSTIDWNVSESVHLGPRQAQLVVGGSFCSSRLRREAEVTMWP